MLPLADRSSFTVGDILQLDSILNDANTTTMAEGLRSLGILVDENPDGAVVHGGKLSGGSVRSHGDHRIAMSFAAGATVAESSVHIAETDAVNTSFPGFVACLNSLGVNIIEQQDAAGEALE